MYSVFRALCDHLSLDGSLFLISHVLEAGGLLEVEWAVLLLTISSPCVRSTLVRFFYFYIFYFRFRNLQKYTPAAGRPGPGRPAAGWQWFFCKKFH
jgi:hypothetical protein